MGAEKPQCPCWEHLCDRIHSGAAAVQAGSGSALCRPGKCGSVLWGKSSFPSLAEESSVWERRALQQSSLSARLPRAWIQFSKGICGHNLSPRSSCSRALGELVERWRTRSSLVVFLPSWKPTLFYLGAHESGELASSRETAEALNLNVHHL